MKKDSCLVKPDRSFLGKANVDSKSLEKLYPQDYRKYKHYYYQNKILLDLLGMWSRRYEGEIRYWGYNMTIEFDTGGYSIATKGIEKIDSIMFFVKEYSNINKDQLRWKSYKFDDLSSSELHSVKLPINDLIFFSHLFRK